MDLTTDVKVMPRMWVACSELKVNGKLYDYLYFVDVDGDTWLLFVADKVRGKEKLPCAKRVEKCEVTIDSNRSIVIEIDAGKDGYLLVSTAYMVLLARYGLKEITVHTIAMQNPDNPQPLGVN